MRMPIYLPTDPPANVEAPILPQQAIEPYNLLFPFQGGYISDEVEPETLGAYPVKATVAKCVEWWWRVKEWDLRVSGNGPLGAFSTGSPIRIKANTDLVHNSVREMTAFSNTPFVQASSMNRISRYEYIDSIEYPDQTAYLQSNTLRIKCDMRFMMRGGMPDDSRYEDLSYYILSESAGPESFMLPLLSVRVDVIHTLTNTNSRLCSFLRDDMDPTEVEGTAGQFLLDGIGFQGVEYIVADDGGYGLDDFMVSIVPAVYWDYSGESGPIWDSATGAQLRNLVTGELLQFD